MPDETAFPDIAKNGMYLHKGVDFVGPFHSFEDAERFITLMVFFGESCTDVEIVEVNESPDSEETRTESGFSGRIR